MGHGQSQEKAQAMDHSKMGHGAMQGQMEGMDHSKMNHGSAEAPRTTSRTPIPVLTDADRQAAFPPLPGHKVHDSAINSFFLLDQLEYQDADEGSTLAWDALWDTCQRMIDFTHDSVNNKTQQVLQNLHHAGKLAKLGFVDVALQAFLLSMPLRTGVKFGKCPQSAVHLI